jgi:hypothetical protein
MIMSVQIFRHNIIILFNKTYSSLYKENNVKIL